MGWQAWLMVALVAGALAVVVIEERRRWREDRAARRAAEANASAVLDDVFVGATVTIESSRATLCPEAFVNGGTARGYALLTRRKHLRGERLVFERARH